MTPDQKFSLYVRFSLIGFVLVFIYYLIADTFVCKCSNFIVCGVSSAGFTRLYIGTSFIGTYSIFALLESGKSRWVATGYWYTHWL